MTRSASFEGAARRRRVRRPNPSLRWAALRRLVALARKDGASMGTVLWALGIGWGMAAYLTRKAFYGDVTAVSLLPAIGRCNAAFVFVAAVVLGRGLVVRDYRQRTQQFVEALPLRRIEAVGAKLLLGALCLLVASGVTLSLAYWDQGESSFQLYQMLWARTGGYIWAVWPTSVLLGLVGRYRWVAYLLGGLTAMVLSERGIDVAGATPVALMTEDFGLERYEWPVNDLATAVAWGVVAVGLVLGLASYREGSAAEQLARRASSQEKAGLLGLGAVLALLVGTMDSGRRSEDFEFHGSPLLVSDRADIEVMVGQDSLKPRGRTLIHSLELLAERLRREFPLVNWPPVRVAHNGLLTAPPMRLDASGPAGGFLLEANLGDDSLDDWGLAKILIHELIGVRSEGRALFEPNHWFADGFTAFWSSEALLEDGPSTRRRVEKMWLSALVTARRLPLNSEQWRAWEKVMEAVGEDAATALAYTLVQTFDEAYGRAALLRLAQCILWQPTVSNGLQWLFSERCDLPRALEAVSRDTWESLLATYGERLSEFREQLRPRLQQIPQSTAQFTADRSGAGVVVRYELRGFSPVQSRACRLRHGEIAAADRYVATSSLAVRALPWSPSDALHSGTLEGLYTSGQRLIVLVDCEEPLLEGFVRLGVARLEVP